jgi:CrcB protein
VALERIILIFTAGGLGALTRYGVQGYVNDLVGRPTVLGTLVVNLSGAFALGLLMAFTEDRLSIPPLVRTTAAVGFLGAYTTFSTLMFESFNKVDMGDTSTAVINLAGSVVLGFVAVYLGTIVGRSI